MSSLQARAPRQGTNSPTREDLQDEPPITNLNVWIPTALHRSLKSVAGAEGVTMTEIVIWELEAWKKRVGVK